MKEYRTDNRKSDRNSRESEGHRYGTKDTGRHGASDGRSGVHDKGYSGRTGRSGEGHSMRGEAADRRTGRRPEERGRSFAEGRIPAGMRPERKPLPEDRRPGFEREEPSPNILYGRNPVMEALKSGRDIEKLLLQNGIEGSAKVIEALAREKNLRIQYVERYELDHLAQGGTHQGVLAFTSPYRYYELEDLLEDAKNSDRDPLIIILDGLEDPHNLGAILRTADCVGATGVIIPKNRSVSLTESAAKASAGAAEYVKVAKVTNLSQTMDELKANGFWAAACDMDGECFTGANLTGPMAVVIGGEGQGVSRLMREKCDFIVSIPMQGHVNSLNASNAAAILLYEIDRQRRVSAAVPV